MTAPQPGPVVVHTTTPHGAAALCGATGGAVVAWEAVTDPANPAVFTCGQCLLALGDGRESMSAGDQP